MSGSSLRKAVDLVTSMSGSESHTSLVYRFFFFMRQPGLRFAFDVAKRKGKFGRIRCQRSKESSKGKKKREVFQCRRTARVAVNGKTIPTTFLKLKEENFVRWGKRSEKGGQIAQLVGDQSLSLKAPSRCKKERSKGDVSREATA